MRRLSREVANALTVSNVSESSLQEAMLADKLDRIWRCTADMIGKKKSCLTKIGPIPSYLLFLLFYSQGSWRQGFQSLLGSLKGHENFGGLCPFYTRCQLCAKWNQTYCSKYFAQMCWRTKKNGWIKFADNCRSVFKSNLYGRKLWPKPEVSKKNL